MAFRFFNWHYLCHRFPTQVYKNRDARGHANTRCNFIHAKKEKIVILYDYDLLHTGSQPPRVVLHEPICEGCCLYPGPVQKIDQA